MIVHGRLSFTGIATKTLNRRLILFVLYLASD